MIDEHRSVCIEQYTSYRQAVSHEAFPHVRPHRPYMYNNNSDARAWETGRRHRRRLLPPPVGEYRTVGCAYCRRKIRTECMSCIVCSLLAELIQRSSHGVISNKVSGSAWPATGRQQLVLSP
ncbi:hypothetical protein IG631_24137 [Alternaria alternata]|nr:hypothetical protein IG631_24137 [Alternaria alternata]